MRRPEFIARQSRRPSGVVGWVIGNIMAQETAALNVAALAALDLQPADHVLEIGFGHGRTIQRAAGIVTEGLVAGIDLSETMFRMATKRCRRLIEQGRVKLEVGDSAELPFSDALFDKALSVHTIYFWTDPARHLREIHRVLKPGGRLAIGLRPKGDKGGAGDFPDTVYTFYDTRSVEDLLVESGFARPTVLEAHGGVEGFDIVVAERRAQR